MGYITDSIIVLFISGFMYMGYRVGLADEILALGQVTATLLLPGFVQKLIAHYNIHFGLKPAIEAVIIWIAIALFFFIVFSIIRRRIDDHIDEKDTLSHADQILGCILGLIKGIIVITAIFYILHLILPDGKFHTLIADRSLFSASLDSFYSEAIFPHITPLKHDSGVMIFQ